MTPFTMQERGFALGDSVMFWLLCFLSCIGGLWYSIIGSRRIGIMDLRGYLLGRSMSILPIAISLMASYLSAFTIVDAPSEIYNYGLQYWLVVFGILFSCIIVSLVYLPVYFTLSLSSSYEYLELRFNKHVRAVASILFLFDEVLFLPIVVFIPATALNQMTGYSVITTGAVMVLICGVYTALGGLRAVVWTDVAQMSIMLLSILLVALVGTIVVGGVVAVFEITSVSGRTDLSNWDIISFYKRETPWGALIGAMSYWTCFNSVNQTMVQRYIALNTIGKARVAIGIFGVGSIMTITLCVYCGLAAYATWVTTGCHPHAAPIVDDRLLPAFVTYMANRCGLPGLSGIFLAGLFGAGLSSLSVILNACVLVILEDLLHGWLQIRLTPFKEGLVVRAMTMVLAIFSLIMLVLVKELEGMLGVSTALSAITASITCGIFTLGLMCSWVGPRGAITGALAGAVVSFYFAVGSHVAKSMGLHELPIGVSMQCPNITSFQNIDVNLDPESIFPLLRISFQWVSPAGLLTTLIVGAIVGRSFDVQDKIVMDAELFSPVVWRFLPAKALADAGEVRLSRKSQSLIHSRFTPLTITPKNKVENNNRPSSNNNHN
ncbi:unnamed protein product [Arctia plantaginis]|uniref:Sodium-coupled monocarboxylate transporter 1 n=1 Tax=Arctia plantaginis TaxID=874455 RepID=A0A8S0ZFH6_ARCPL|nr:unnamed protein product [Arctia plantaginis]